MFDALQSLAGLEGVDTSAITVLVVDNDETDALRSRMEKFARDFPLRIRYVHAPAKNISIARNAALDGAETRWISFMDDDEVASPNWIAELLSVRDDATAVIGRCDAVYGSGLPNWIERCDFHSTRIDGNPANGYAGNALLDVAFLQDRQIRFKIELGRTGGEDTVFFRQIAEAGGRIVYNPAAVVYEPVPPARASMKWVLRRKYRAGQTHGLVCREFHPAAYSRLAVTAAAKTAVSAAMALVTIPGSVASRKWFARASLHAGALHYRIKPALLEEYG